MSNPAHIDGITASNSVKETLGLSSGFNENKDTVGSRDLIKDVPYHIWLRLMAAHC